MGNGRNQGLVEPQPHKPNRLTHGVPDIRAFGTAVDLDHTTVDSQEWRPAVRLGVHPRTDALQSPTGDGGSEHSPWVGRQLLAKHGSHRLAETLGRLQNNISNEPITDADIHAIHEEVVAFAVSGGVEP